MSYVLSSFSEVYGFAGVTLFATLCLIIALEFHQLSDRVQSDSDKFNQKLSKKKSEVGGSETILEWKRTQSTLLETVSYLQDCFGPFLLIWIVYVFVNVISNSYYMVDTILHFGWTVRGTWLSISDLARNLGNLFVLTIASVILNCEVPSFRF